MSKRQTQKDKVWSILISKGQIDNFFAIDTRLSIRLGDIIFKLRNEKGHDHILTDTEFNGQDGKNCIYKLNPVLYRHIVCNGIIDYWELKTPAYGKI